MKASTATIERVERLRYECLPTWKPKQQRRAYGMPMIDWHRQRRQAAQYCRLAKGVNDANSSH